MAFFDTLKQNLMTTGQTTVDKAKTTVEILKLKDQIRQDKREIRSATYKIGEIYRELHSEDYEEAYEDCFQKIERLEQAIDWKEDALKMVPVQTYEQSRQSLAEILPYEKVLSLPNLFLPNILASTQENRLPMH